MKTYKQFISESVNVSGDFNGNIYINNSSKPELEQVGEQFVADIVWQGSIYRLQLKTESNIPSKQQLTEKLQKQYPGSIVHNIYPMEEKNNDIINSQRYHPGKLEWL